MSESGSRFEHAEVQINSPEIIFGVDKDFDEHVGSMEEACNANDLDETKELLGKNKFVENIVIRKGKNKELLRLLERAINSMAQAEVGKDITAVADTAELERIIGLGELPPFALAELAGALYHLKLDDEGEQLAKLLTGVETSVAGAVTQANAFNTLGCIYLRQGDIKGSSEAHKAGLALLPKEEGLNIQWQASKLKYGILIDKMERKIFPDVPEQLFALRRERERLGDTYNIGRVDLDVARAFNKLKKRDEAIYYAERGRDLMGQVGYWTGAGQAAELVKQLKQTK